LGNPDCGSPAIGEAERCSLCALLPAPAASTQDGDCHPFFSPGASRLGFVLASPSPPVSISFMTFVDLVEALPLFSLDKFVPFPPTPPAFNPLFPLSGLASARKRGSMHFVIAIASPRLPIDRVGLSLTKAMPRSLLARSLPCRVPGDQFVPLRLESPPFTHAFSCTPFGEFPHDQHWSLPFQSSPVLFC